MSYRLYQLKKQIDELYTLPDINYNKDVKEILTEMYDLLKQVLPEDADDD